MLLDCPKCTGSLVPQTFGDISIHRCDACAGLWVDAVSLECMKTQWMAEAVLDIGNPKVGTSLDGVTDIHCPLGHGPMEPVEDPQQYHIWYEICRTCGGMFFDAGEFTDLKFETPLDTLRKLIKGHRPES